MAFDPALTRRTFISLSAALAATYASSGSLNFEPEAQASILNPGTTRTPSFCEICFWKCGIDVWKDAQGRVVQITGSTNHPLSNGRLCPRGTGGMGALYDPDRIRQPMIRKGDQWRAATWDEALGYIAERMQAIRKQYSPSALALLNHGHSASFFRHLMNAYGAPIASAPSFAQCRGPRDVGFQLTYGVGVGSPEITDLENTTLLVLIGCHLGENMHNTQVQEFATAIGRGMELVVIDPRFSVAAGKAQHWLPAKAGTDLALLLAWIRLLIEEGWYNKPFVEQHCQGLAELRAAVSPYTPEWAYTQTGIEPETIRLVARKLGMHQTSALIHPGRRVNWYGDDTQRSRAVAILNALLGNWGRQGGFFMPQRFDVGRYPTPAYPKPDEEFDRLVRAKFPFADEVPTQFLRDHTLAGGKPPVKGWIVYGTDLFNSIPDKERTIAAIKKLDLLVVIDILPIELTGWADVVLPDTTYLERYDDLNNPPWKTPFVSLRQPVVEPMYDSKPAWWMARELGLRLGLQAYFPWKNLEEYLDTRLRTAGLTLEQMKADGVASRTAPPPYTQQPRFFTPSGKVELYSPRLKQLGFDPVPKYTPPAAPPPGFFRLLIGRMPVHSFGRTTNNRVLTEIADQNEVWVNAITAREFRLTSGQYVRLINQDGVKSDPIRVKVTERIRPDCVYMAHGFGRKAEKMHQAYGKGAADNDLMTNVLVDPLMGGTSTNTNFVTFAKSEPPPELLREVSHV